MPRDDLTYGFNREDADELLQLTGGRESAFQRKAVAALTMFYIARLNAPWSSGSADADIYDVDGTTITDSGTDETIYDPLLMFATLTTDDYIWVFRQGGKLYALQAPCPG